MNDIARTPIRIEIDDPLVVHALRYFPPHLHDMILADPPEMRFLPGLDDVYGDYSPMHHRIRVSICEPHVLCHEAVHALDRIVGGGWPASRRSVVVRTAYANAKAGRSTAITEYALDSPDEYLAESMVAYLCVPEGNELGGAYRHRGLLRELDPLGWEMCRRTAEGYDGLFEVLSRHRAA